MAQEIKITKNKVNEFRYKMNVLNDNSVQWFYERRITNLLQITPIGNNLEEEWANVASILKQAAKESLREKKKMDQKKGCQNMG
jgi:hypothetical protein